MSSQPAAALNDLSLTERNLWQAIVSEAVAHLTYMAYARQARAEGNDAAAAVLEQVAAAETAHGIRYLEVVGAIGDTAANLGQVIEGETREYTRTYPRMISDALAEGRCDAAAALTAAMEEEREHQMAFSDALAQLELPAAVGGNGGAVGSSGAGAMLATAAAGPIPVTAEPPALPLDLETYVDAARALDREPFQIANLGRLREVVFGAQDGIISTVALTTSIAAAGLNTGAVLVAGLTAAAAGVISMAAGAYLGSRAEEDVRAAAIERETRQLEEKPAAELAELVILFQREGQTYDAAVHLANDIAGNRRLWLNTLLEKKLGISPHWGGSPLKDAAVMGVSFGASAVIPIIPYLFLTVGAAAIGWSVGLSLAGLFILGLIKGRLVRKGPLLQGLEILGIGAASAALGYILGELLPRALGLGF